MIIKKYILKHMDYTLGKFFMEGQQTINAIFYKSTFNHLPLPLKRLIHNKNEFTDLNKENCDEWYINEDGGFLIDAWLMDRAIPTNRDNYKKYIERGKTPKSWMFDNYGFSFIDNYWFYDENENITWEQIKEICNDKDEYYSVNQNIEDNIVHYKGHNSTLGGQLEKFWYNQNNELYLCKKVDKPYQILNAREIIASLIYNKQGYPACKYNFVLDHENEIVGCTCKAFTDENIELVTAYELLEEYNLTQQDDVYELICELAGREGIDAQIVSDYMDIQTIVDFLITNRDRHEGNIGFLRDTNTLKFLMPAPIYDSGSSKHMEGQFPETAKDTTINGLYSTELECLNHVKNFKLINIDKLPNEEEILQILDKCDYIPNKRKDKFLNLYREKIQYLRELQLTRPIQNAPIYTENMLAKYGYSALDEKNIDLDNEDEIII